MFLLLLLFLALVFVVDKKRKNIGLSFEEKSLLLIMPVISELGEYLKTKHVIGESANIHKKNAVKYLRKFLSDPSIRVPKKLLNTSFFSPLKRIRLVIKNGFLQTILESEDVSNISEINYYLLNFAEFLANPQFSKIGELAGGIKQVSIIEKSVEQETVLQKFLHMDTISRILASILISVSSGVITASIGMYLGLDLNVIFSPVVIGIFTLFGLLFSLWAMRK